MKLWLLLYEYPYEGQEIVGLYYTEQSARAEMEKKPFGPDDYNQYTIQEWGVEE